MKRLAATSALILALAAPGRAATNERPSFDPKIGAIVDTALAFTDATGTRNTLAGFAEGRPALLLLGYHRCPNLCGVANLDLAAALSATGLSPSSYSVIFASIDPAETPADADAARHKLAAANPGANLAPWHFVTGDAASVAALEASLGLTVRKIPAQDLYVHPVAVSTLTPAGRLSRVLPGIDYEPRDLRLALIEASAGRLGTLGDRILLFCSGFDPTTGRYSDAVMFGLRLASLAGLLAAGGTLAFLHLRRKGHP